MQETRLKGSLNHKLFLVLAVMVMFFTMGTAVSAGSDYYYNQLTEQEKGYYQTIDKSGLKTGTLTPILVTKSAEKIHKNVERAVQAYAEDHPEIFWTNAAFMTHNKTEDGYWEYYIKPILNPGFSESNLTLDINLVRNTVKTIAAGASKKKTDYDKLLYIHDWLTKNNSYNTDANQTDGMQPWSAYSALADGYRPVCEGYSKAFKMVCDELGIPCVIVDNTAHMWNYVSIRGRWYAVDVTYDDPVVKKAKSNKSGRETKKNFLVGMMTKVGRDFFITSHTPGTWRANFGLKLPELMNSKYSKNNDVKSVGLNRSKATIKLTARKTTLKLKASVRPSKAINKAISWTNTNPEVAEIIGMEGAYCIVQAKAPGTTTIFVTTAEGGYTKKCVITVKQK